MADMTKSTLEERKVDLKLAGADELRTAWYEQGYLAARDDTLDFIAVELDTVLWSWWFIKVRVRDILWLFEKLTGRNLTQWKKG